MWTSLPLRTMPSAVESVCLDEIRTIGELPVEGSIACCCWMAG
jgi:hypothetical protein